MGHAKSAETGQQDGCLRRQSFDQLSDRGIDRLVYAPDWRTERVDQRGIVATVIRRLAVQPLVTCGVELGEHRNEQFRTGDCYQVVDDGGARARAGGQAREHVARLLDCERRLRIDGTWMRTVALQQER